MAPLGQISSARSLNGLLRSYGRDLRGWTGSVTIRYAVAVILLLSGGASVLGAIGVGLAALFHWLEARYGSNSAYGIVSGLLILLGLICAIAGILLLKRPLPHLPSPRRQMKEAGRSVAGDAMLAISAPHKALMKADPVTETMIGLAAACLVGWLVSSRLGR